MSWNDFLELTKNPFFSPLLSAAILGIGTRFMRIESTRLSTNAQIKINDAAEKAKLEIQRAYLLTEIKVRHLLEIYPRLHNSVHAAAGPYITYFTTILNQIERIRSQGKEPNDKELYQFFADYWPAVSSNDGLPKLDVIQQLNNDLADARLFISDGISEIVEEMKKEIMNLFQLVRHEIGDNQHKTYSKDQLFDLLNRASISIAALHQNKDFLAKRMNKELTSSF